MNAVLLTVDKVAEVLDVSTRKVWSMNSTGAMPELVRMGRSVRWRAVDIAEWVAMGCPSREQFEAEKHSASP